jgi:hypothetical protein
MKRISRNTVQTCASLLVLLSLAGVALGQSLIDVSGAALKATSGSTSLLLLPQSTNPFPTITYYVATSGGSDSNSGTSPSSPWTMLSLFPPNNTNTTTQSKANYAAWAGHVVGLLPGTYSLSVYFQAAQTSGSTAIISIPGGTSGSNTGLVCVNSSGVYTPLTCTVDGGYSVGSGDSYQYAPPIGSDTTRAVNGYISVGGLIVQNCNGACINFWYGSGHSNNLLIRDNVCQNLTTTVQGNNPAFIRYQLADNLTITNNIVKNWVGNAATTIVSGHEYIIITTGTTNFVALGAANNNPQTQFTSTGTGSGTGTVAVETNGQALAGILGYYANGYVISYNTVYGNVSVGIHPKGSGSSGGVNDNQNGQIYNNYVEANFTPAGSGIGLLDFASHATTSVNYVHHNIFWGGYANGIAHGGTDSSGSAPSDTNYVYNNAMFNTASNGSAGTFNYIDSSQSLVNSFHDNIIYRPDVTTDYQGQYAVYTPGTGLSDYNCFDPRATSNSDLYYTTTYEGTATGETLSGWKTATGLDAHSIAANPMFSNPVSISSGGGPSGFTLQSGSSCKGAGTSGGDIGPWNGQSQIGANINGTVS